MKEIFLKKRKNLILISIILIFVELAQVKIELINILGNEIHIKNPMVLTVFIWLVFFYYFAMFHYYFKIVEKDSEFEYVISEYRRILLDNCVSNSFIEKLDELHKRYITQAKSWVYEDAKITKKGKLN